MACQEVIYASTSKKIKENIENNLVKKQEYSSKKGNEIEKNEVKENNKVKNKKKLVIMGFESVNSKIQWFPAV